MHGMLLAKKICMVDSFAPFKHMHAFELKRRFRAVPKTEMRVEAMIVDMRWCKLL